MQPAFLSSSKVLTGLILYSKQANLPGWYGLMKKSVRSRKWSSSLRIVSRCMLSSCTKFGGFGGTALLLPYECDPAFDAMSARKSTSHPRDLCTIHLQQTYRCAEIQVSYTESRFTDATFHSVSNSSSRSTPRRPILHERDQHLLSANTGIRPTHQAHSIERQVLKQSRQMTPVCGIHTLITS